MKHEITTHQIPLNNPIFNECAEWLPTQDWYIGSTGLGAKIEAGPSQLDQKQKYGIFRESVGSQDGGCVTKLNSDGSVIKDTSVVGVSGVWRSPFGWNDESLKRRSPKVWNLFEYINNNFFNAAFTLDGFPEEIGATGFLFKDQPLNDPTIPFYGTTPEPGNMHPIWTSYGIGKTGGVHSKGSIKNSSGNRRKVLGTVGIHRDTDVDCGDEQDADGYFSIICCMNLKWKPSWGGDLLYYETTNTPEEADELHWKRGYGIGYASDIIPHKPGLVSLIPAVTLHAAASDRYMPERTEYLRRIMFRVRYKDLHNVYTED